MKNRRGFKFQVEKCRGFLLCLDFEENDDDDDDVDLNSWVLRYYGTGA